MGTEPSKPERGKAIHITSGFDQACDGHTTLRNGSDLWETRQWGRMKLPNHRK